MIPKQQYRRLMSEYQETGDVTVSAMKADMSRPTVRKYLVAGKPPGELQAKHSWRTREDPLEEIWAPAQAMLEEAPDLEAKALFEYLSERMLVAKKELRLENELKALDRYRVSGAHSGLDAGASEQ